MRDDLRKLCEELGVDPEDVEPIDISIFTNEVGIHAGAE